MTAHPPAPHPDRRELAEVAAGGPCAPALAAHLAACPSCRGELARRDPSAVFALLQGLPASLVVPEMPRLALPALVSLRARIARGGLGLAAAGALAAALWSAARAPGPERPEYASRSVGEFSVQVDNPSAQVVTLVPSGEGPAVILVVGVEIGL